MTVQDPSKDHGSSLASSSASRPDDCMEDLSLASQSELNQDQSSISGPNKYLQWKLSLQIRQQPHSARVCPENGLRFIDPPIVLQLYVDAPKATPKELENFLSLAVVHCKLWHSNEDVDVTMMPGMSKPHMKNHRQMSGPDATAVFVGQDEFGVKGNFFCFPDLGVRRVGKYRLDFSLVILELGHNASPRAPVQSRIRSDVFPVQSQRQYNGLTARSKLTKALRKQNCPGFVQRGSQAPMKRRETKRPKRLQILRGTTSPSDRKGSLQNATTRWDER